MKPGGLNRLKSISPIVTVNDLPQALEFYQRKLGFALAWSWGTPPEMAAVCLDEVEIMLAQRTDVPSYGPSRVYLVLSDVDAFHTQIRQSGVEVSIDLADRPYGMRDFRIVDASGNELSFGQPSVKSIE